MKNGDVPSKTLKFHEGTQQYHSSHLRTPAIFRRRTNLQSIMRQNLNAGVRCFWFKYTHTEYKLYMEPELFCCHGSLTLAPGELWERHKQRCALIVLLKFVDLGSSFIRTFEQIELKGHPSFGTIYTYIQSLRVCVCARICIYDFRLFAVNIHSLVHRYIRTYVHTYIRT